VTVGVRPLREGEQPLLDATAGHLTVLGPAGHEDSPPLLVTPVQSVALTVESAHVEKLQAESSDSVEVVEPQVVAQNLKRKGNDDAPSTSKRRRHLIADEESSAEDDTSATGVEKETAKASPLL
jgi:hypothetical protein